MTGQRDPTAWYDPRFLADRAGRIGHWSDLDLWLRAAPRGGVPDAMEAVARYELQRREADAARRDRERRENDRLFAESERRFNARVAAVVAREQAERDRKRREVQRRETAIHGYMDQQQRIRWAGYGVGL